MTNSTVNKDYCASANLISTTDASSHITHANDDFCNIAGYDTHELIGNPHNIVRHQDMPKLAFGQLWSYLQQGKSWMGLVKNQCKDNQHYWVSAFVTPIKDAEGNTIEYQSVRSKPTREQVTRAETLYAKLSSGKIPKKLRLPLHTLSIIFAALFTASSLASAFINPSLTTLLSTLLGLTVTANTIYQSKRFRKVAELAHDAYANPLMEKPYTNKFDDYSQIELALMMKKAELRAVTARATETAGQILISAEDEFGTIQSIGHSLDQQCQETEQVSAAVEELTQSITEVANAASAASALAEEADQESKYGLESIRATIAEVNTLSEELAQAQEIITRLSHDSQKIDSILEVITTISEQTNLLALNAAIEAARAGEAGRGFAVVADEVRNLASKTGSSANEIHEMISHLQTTAGSAVNAMEKGMVLSQQCKTRADGTGQVLDTISSTLTEVTDSSLQIAAAVEEQATVTKEINRNIVNIKTLSDDTLLTSQTSIQRTSALVDKLEGLQRLMKQFQTS
ncbi:methyl-accepting chemotaxis protein [Vibrio galatheae]|nr:PAS domain-containing methyl-accepting chemotaxis protein [Vibrio galatheae]